MEIDGIQQAGFVEVSGLEMALETTEYREGNDSVHTRHLSGLRKCSTLVLKFGITESRELYQWFKSCADGDVQRKNISVVALNFKGEDKARWTLTAVWPIKYTGPSFNAKGNEVAMEELELVYEEIERVN